jgi:hypothetical protein
MATMLLSDFRFRMQAKNIGDLIMAKMTAAQAAAHVLEKEGVTQVFGVPGAAINPFYAAMKHPIWLKAIPAPCLATSAFASAHPGQQAPT